MITCIYGLFDPRSPGMIMYVGKGLAARAQSHWKKFLVNGDAINFLVRRWLGKLKTEGIEPSWRFLEENVTNWEERERYWIAYWRDKNPELCNVSNGGNYVRLTAEEKFRASQLGGLAGGSKGAKRVHELHPDLASKNMQHAWDFNRGKMLEVTSLGGSAAARLGRSGLITAWREKPEEMTKHAKENASLGGAAAKEFFKNNPEIARANGVKKAHDRWHVNRHLINSNCRLCCEAWIKRRLDIVRLFEIACSQ
jgi:hypothetical protein